MEGDADCCFLSIRLLSRLLHLILGNFFCCQPVFTVHRPLALPLTTCHHLDSSTRHPDIIPRALDYHLNKVGKKIRQKWPTSTCPLLPLSDLVSFFLFLIHLKADFGEDVMGEKAFSKRK